MSRNESNPRARSQRFPEGLRARTAQQYRFACAMAVSSACATSIYCLLRRERSYTTSDQAQPNFYQQPQGFH